MEPLKHMNCIYAECTHKITLKELFFFFGFIELIALMIIVKENVWKNVMRCVFVCVSSIKKHNI